MTQLHALILGIISDQLALMIKKKKDKFISEGGLDKITITRKSEEVNTNEGSLKNNSEQLEQTSQTS